MSLKNGRLTKLKQALAKLEMPSGSSQNDQHAPLASSSAGKGGTNTSVAVGSENDDRPTLGFQRAMRDPNHPDFGMSFTAALDLAMVKEKQAHVQAVSDGIWISDGSEHASPMKPKPQSRHHMFNSLEIGTQQKYDIVECIVARASQTGGLDFRDARLVDIFNRITQRDNPRRPIRTQASLLDIARTDPMQYFGEDVLILLELSLIHI